MTSTRNPADIIDLDDLQADLDAIETISDSLALAGHALADPLAKARQGQMTHEVARVARVKGADHPEVALRQANLERATARFALLAEERDRSRVAQPEFNAKQGIVWGRVTDAGVPQDDLSVSAEADGERLGFTCTDAQGGFTLTLPTDRSFRLSVRAKSGAELYRDNEADSLSAGQQLYREIDLTRGAQSPCPEPDDGPGTDPESFAMVDLTGQSERAAIAILSNLGLTRGARTTEMVEDGVGLILSHSPAAGDIVNRGDAIDLTVSVATGISVPDLVGLPLERAQAILKKSQLETGAVSQVVVTGERAGLVVSQLPQAQSVVPAGTAVSLAVGIEDPDTPARDTVPEILGRKPDVAAEILKEAGFELGEISEVASERERAGLILSQLPAAGSVAPAGSAVSVTVGVFGPSETDDVEVPNLVGRTEKDARAILAAAGLETGSVKTEPVADAQVEIVLDQTPDAGARIARNAAVDLVVGERREQDETVEVPTVVGQRQAAAEEALKAAGFDPAVQTRQVTNRVQVGVVLAQEPPGRSRATRGSRVTIVVGAASVTPGRGTERFTAIVTETESSLDLDVSLSERLKAADVSTVEDIDKVLEMDRREARSVFGVRTLAQTDTVLRALRKARANQDSD